jgi:uncharacterized membrane protein
MIRTILLIFGCISFIVVMGGAVYEHAAVVPVWTRAVPASLTMFQGEYGLAAGNFWIPIHPVTIALLVMGLIANWKTPRRNYIGLTLIGYIGVLVVTSLYFVPELMSLIQSSYSPTVDAELTRRAQRWETLSLVRLGFLFVLAVVLLMGLTKNTVASNSNRA